MIDEIHTLVRQLSGSTMHAQNPVWLQTATMLLQLEEMRLQNEHLERIGDKLKELAEND